ncbi:Photosystem II reaction center protein H [Dendrobium catenatum]|uniref:Photosystem II reaction center protein H n=1 Tax=Dendrobium catenatum TaxID=906689 RepID=A0A2I0X0Q9_9ASPA|nr:Photosystem II reaction center protein H [Dendrobium catenatum]
MATKIIESSSRSGPRQKWCREFIKTIEFGILKRNSIVGDYTTYRIFNGTICIFLSIILEIYNSSVLLDGISIN